MRKITSGQSASLDFLSTYGLQAFCKSMWTGQIAERTKLPRPARARVLITRRKSTREHNKTVAKMRNERLAQDPAFDLFETEIPEAAAIAEAFSKRMPTFHTKWGPAIVTVLSNLSDETRETLNGA